MAGDGAETVTAPLLDSSVAEARMRNRCVLCLILSVEDIEERKLNEVVVYMKGLWRMILLVELLLLAVGVCRRSAIQQEWK